MKAQTDQKTGLAAKWPYITIALLLLLGVGLYYRGYYRTRTVAELLPVAVEEAEWCTGFRTDREFESSGLFVLTPEEKEELASLFKEIQCRRYETANGLPVPNYHLFLPWPDGEHTYVDVMFTADCLLVNTKFDGKAGPMYLILSGGEELTAFVERVVSRTGGPEKPAPVLN